MIQTIGDSSSSRARSPQPLKSSVWMLDRLAAMGPAEIAYRFGEQLKRLASRYYQPDFSHLVTGQPAALPSIPGLAEGLGGLTAQTTLRGTWRSQAEHMRNGRFQALGVTWPAQPGPPKWHLDPKPGTSWPNEVYCFDTKFRDAPERGDIKFVYELNRLQYLQPMAAVAATENDGELANLVVEHLDSWISANPPYQGIAWRSGIELAQRVVSLLVVTTFIGDQAFSETLRQRLYLCLAGHGYWLARFPSKYSSANNHRVAEAGGLYLLGSLVPALRHAAHWARSSREILEAELARQFHDDGVGAEQSPTYSAFTLEWFLLCATVGGRLGDTWSQASWQRMARAGHHLRAVTDMSGHQPRIGDDDEGRVLYSQQDPQDYSLDTCPPPPASPTWRARPRITPHLGQAMFGAAVPAARDRFEYASFPDGGNTAIREWRQGDEILWVMYHGPLGYLSIATHGHADALSLWLHINGRPVLADAGTYLGVMGRQEGLHHLLATIDHLVHRQGQRDIC